MKLKDVLENLLMEMDTIQETGMVSISPLISTIYSNIKDKKKLEKLKEVAKNLYDHTVDKERIIVKKLQELFSSLSIPEEATIVYLLTYKTKIPITIKANLEASIEDKFLCEVYDIPQTFSIDSLYDIENKIYFKTKIEEIQEIIINRGDARRLEAKKVKKLPESTKDYVAVIVFPKKTGKKHKLYGDIMQYEKRTGIVKFDEEEMMFYIASENGGYYRAEEYVAEFYMPLEEILPQKTEKQESKNSSTRKKKLKP